MTDYGRGENFAPPSEYDCDDALAAIERDRDTLRAAICEIAQDAKELLETCQSKIEDIMNQKLADRLAGLQTVDCRNINNKLLSTGGVDISSAIQTAQLWLDDELQDLLEETLLEDVYAELSSEEEHWINSYPAYDVEPGGLRRL